jgi:hypothetical protein
MNPKVLWCHKHVDLVVVCKVFFLIVVISIVVFLKIQPKYVLCVCVIEKSLTLCQ